MKKIFLMFIMCVCFIALFSCDNNNNNNNDDKFQGYLELKFNNSNFDNYTYYDKNVNNISDYNLDLIQVLYYYEQDKFATLNKSQYYITITDKDNNVVNELSSNLDVGVYNIAFTHFVNSLTKEIKFEVTDSSDITSDPEYEGKIVLNFNNSNFSYYTSFIKGTNSIDDYDLNKIIVLYYYQKDKYTILESSQYTVTITDDENNVIDNLSEDMTSGIYDITFTHTESLVSKTIKFEFIGKEELPIVNGVLNPAYIDTSKETVVIFYHAMGAKNQQLIQDIIDNFEEEMYTKYGVRVTVDQRGLGDYDTLRNTIAAGIASGVQPTVAQAYPDHVSFYLQGKAISSLDKFIEHEEYGLTGSKEDSYGYIDRFFNEGNIYDKEGTTYSLPFNKSTEVLYYNIELFEKYDWKVPETWDDVIAICEAWKETSEYKAALNYGKKVAGIGIDSGANFFTTLIQQWGSEVTGFDENGIGEFRFDSVETRNALNWLVKEFNNGNIVTTDSGYWSDLFKAVQIPMILGSSAGASYNIPSDGSFTTGVAPYPQISGAKEDEKFVIQQGTNVTLFNCNDKQEELFGWLFIKYLTNYESSLRWALNTGYFPIRKDVAASEEYQEYLSYDSYDTVREAIKVGLEQSEYFYVTPTFFGSSMVRDEGVFIIQAILYYQEEYSVDKAIKEAMEALKNNE